jgi:hypothetical protein
MSYILCPGCGDPVAGRIPSGSEERTLTCVHCHCKFSFTDGDERSGLVFYDEGTRRWQVHTLKDALAENERLSKGQQRRMRFGSRTGR